MARRRAPPDPEMGGDGPKMWTIGHSTRTWEAFRDLLQEHGIRLLADVRHFPSSQRVPWTNRAALPPVLGAVGVAYEHYEDLGGYRRPRAGSANLGWRSGGFRGYADHTDTDAFRTALDRLLVRAGERRTVIMCAEAVPWRCHRFLLSDALWARGARVVHILGRGRSQEHRPMPFARVRGGRVTYPAAPANTHKRPRR